MTDGVASVLCGCVQALMNRIDSAVARLGGFRALKKKTLSGALHDHKIQSSGQPEPFLKDLGFSWAPSVITVGMSMHTVLTAKEVRAAARPHDIP